MANEPVLGSDGSTHVGQVDAHEGLGPQAASDPAGETVGLSAIDGDPGDREDAPSAIEDGLSLEGRVTGWRRVGREYDRVSVQRMPESGSRLPVLGEDGGLCEGNRGLSQPHEREHRGAEK